ncbi:MAG TPA: GNAT family N-acetyltransferase [Acidobacteriota bacterium]|nr:GNAT family N-acetyltransferase [Acidobacteriota bacterium]
MLVEAVNQCYDVHFPDAEALTLAAFQAEIRELDMWASNCMVAREDDRLIGVLIAGKRPREVLIRRIGVHPDFQGRGIGSHLLTSLSQKVAVLGPDRLIIELPDQHADLFPFFQKNRYRHETTYYRYTLTEPPTTPPPPEAVIPFSLQDALDNDLIPDDETSHPDRLSHSEPTSSPSIAGPWDTQLPTLKAIANRLRGYAIASPDSIEAFVLFTTSPTGTVIHSCGPAESPPYLPLLLSHTLGSNPPPLLLNAISAAPNLTPTGETQLLTTTAKPL